MSTRLRGCLLAAVAMGTLFSSICFADGATATFPLPKPDYSKIERVRTFAKLWMGRQLRHTTMPCVKTPDKGPVIPQIPWAYLRCRFESTPGFSSVIHVSQEADVPNVLDMFKAVDVVIELKGALETRQIDLPNEQVKLFFHNCRHSWSGSTGCLAGSSVTGYLKYTRVDAVSGILILHLSLKGDPEISPNFGTAQPDEIEPIGLVVRIPVGVPIDLRLDSPLNSRHVESQMLRMP